MMNALAREHLITVRARATGVSPLPQRDSGDAPESSDWSLETRHLCPSEIDPWALLCYHFEGNYLSKRGGAARTDGHGGA